MNIASRNLVMLAAGVVLLMAATLAADVVLSTSGIRVFGPPPTSTGAVLYAELQGSWPQAAAIEGYAPSTGSAVYGNAAGGVGVRGASSSNAGVLGFSSTGTGGVFLSEQGYGVYSYTTGTRIWDHGLYASANQGYGLFARSTTNQGIRAVADADALTGFPEPSGTWGVAGLGRNGGVWGSSKDWHGVYGNSANYLGVYGHTQRTDGNYGLYTPDNLSSNNYHITGAIMQVAENVGALELEPGDVVAFRGIRRPEPDGALTGDATWADVLEVPVVQVSKASETYGTGVAGVVFSRYVAQPRDLERTEDVAVRRDVRPDSSSQVEPRDSPEITPPGPAEPGDLVLIVVHGPAEVRVQPYETSIEPGDLLVAGGIEGHAAKAVFGPDGQSPRTGNVFGTALERIDPEHETIYSYVTLK